MRRSGANSIVRFAAETVYLLGDVHGRFDRVKRVLEQAGLARGIPAGSVLVQVGDLVDRGREDERLVERLARAVPPDEDLRVPDPGSNDRSVSLAAIRDGKLPWSRGLLHSERVAMAGAMDTLATIRGFMALERRSGGRLHCLMGNHDLDLIRGNFHYFERQKIYFLALLGIQPAWSAMHAGFGLSLPEVMSAAPELDWIARRPLLALGEGILAVHGGPTRYLLDSLQKFGIGNIEQLGDWLDDARTGTDHRACREWHSLLTPRMPQDDFVRDAALRSALLDIGPAQVLAVGHSAFLHARHVECPALLAGDRVIKLDTNVKRGGPGWLVQRREGRWSAIGEDGERVALAAADAATVSSPSAQDIETRLYAVHGMNSLPSDDFLRANPAGTHPGFRPGVHFSLGFLRPDNRACGEQYRFAVLTPLRQIVPQLVNVSPLDTFAIGDVPLTSETILVVPDGTDTRHLSTAIPVLQYPPSTGLRGAVQSAIEARRGWVVKLPKSCNIGSVARIERLDVNSSRFFQDFLRTRRHVAFGAQAAR